MSAAATGFTLPLLHRGCVCFETKVGGIPAAWCGHVPVVALEQLTPELLHCAEEIVAEDARHYSRFAVVWRRRARRGKCRAELIIRLQRLDRNSFESVRARLAELGLRDLEPAPPLLRGSTTVDTHAK